MPQPAQYQFGKDVVVVSATVGPKGATLTAKNPGNPNAEISVEIPAGALPREVPVKLSYNAGQLSLPRGQSSGVYFRLGAENVLQFEKPVKIQVHFDPSTWKGYAIVGYAIDANGRLSGVDSGAKDSEKGTASFYTLVPLLFTWVYAPI